MPFVYRCEDGSSALVQRTEMKADPNAVVPKASPTLMKGEKYNIVASADFWAKMALEDAVKECGGQIVPNEGADVYSIWSGSDSDLIPKVGDEVSVISYGAAPTKGVTVTAFMILASSTSRPLSAPYIIAVNIIQAPLMAATIRSSFRSETHDHARPIPT
jgi:hypothetical protein